MYNRSKWPTLVIIISLTVTCLQSCKNTTSSVDDSLGFIRSVEPIEGAQNVTIDLEDGHNEGSMFMVDLSGIESELFISNGRKPAWCIEWDKRVVRGVQEGVKLHSTKGQNLWSDVNYFLSQKESLKQKYTGLGWKETQIVIWSLVKQKEFEIDEIPEYQNFDPDFYNESEYLFDVELAKEIIRSVKANAGNQNKLFKERSSAIILENDGQTVIIRSDESVWAFGQHSFRNQYFRDLLGNTETSEGQWGWIFELDGDYASTELIAGGSSDDGTMSADEVGTIIGSLDVSKSSGTLEITYSTLSGYMINGMRLWVGCSLEKFFGVVNEGNVAPGNFPYSHDGDPTNSHTFFVDLANYNCSGNIFISAHAGELYIVDDGPVLEPVVQIRDLGTLAPQYTEGYARGINDQGEIVGEVHEWFCIEESTELSKIANSLNYNDQGNPGQNLDDITKNIPGIDENNIYQIQIGGDRNYNDRNNTIALRDSLRSLRSTGNITSISNTSNVTNSAPCSGYILFHEGFRWTQDEGMSSLPESFGSENLDQWAASGINNNGQVAGYSHSNFTAAFWDEDNTMIELGLLGGGSRPASEALAINNQGQVVGYKQTSFDQIQAFIWSEDDGLTHLGTLAGHSRSLATDINNSGQVVGESGTTSSDQRYFLWDKENGMTDLGTSQVRSINDHGETSSAIAINNNGQSVNGDGYLYDPEHGAIDLGTLDGGEGCTAYDLNDNGQVAGWCRDSSGNNRPVRWDVTFEAKGLAAN